MMHNICAYRKPKNINNVNKASTLKTKNSSDFILCLGHQKCLHLKYPNNKADDRYITFLYIHIYVKS